MILKVVKFCVYPIMMPGPILSRPAGSFGLSCSRIGTICPTTNGFYPVHVTALILTFDP